MATERQRTKSLDDDILSGDKRVKRITGRSKRAIKGTAHLFASLPNFATNAAVRKRLFAELAKEYKILNSEINDWVDSEVKVTSKNWFNYAKEDLPAGSLTTFGAFSTKYVGDIIAQINPAMADSSIAMNAHIGGMNSSDVRALRAAISTTYAEASVEGLTNRQMAKRMQAKVVRAAGQFTFLDKAGRRWTADNYFSMLNRTLHAQAARQTYANAATTEAGYDLYKMTGGITGSSKKHPDDPCDTAIREGLIFSMTGATKGYPTYDEVLARGIYHPNCVHSMRVVLPSELPNE